MIESGAIVKRLNEMIEERGWSSYQLAKESHMPYTSVFHVLKGKYEPTFLTLSKLCDGLGISMADIFLEIELPEASQQDKLVILFNKLTVRQKELVIAYIEGLLTK